MVNGYVLTYNGEASSAIPEAIVTHVDRPIVGQVRSQRVLVPGRAGAWHFREEPGDMTLRTRIEVVAASAAARRTAIRALTSWAYQDGQPHELIVADEPDRYWLAALRSSSDIDVKASRASVQLSWVCDPFSWAVSTASQSVSATTNPDSDSFTVNDDLPAEPIVTLTAVGGTITGFTWTLNGEALTWAAGTVVLSGESITINGIADVVLQGANNDVNLTGTFDEADVDMQDVSGTFPLLQPGTNTWNLSWTGTATNVAVDIVWRPRYL